MKKIITLLLIISLILGCSKSSSVSKVEEYLAKYNNLDREVLTELENVIAEKDLNDYLKDKYYEVMIRQYQDLTYKIEEEIYEGSKATIKVLVKVSDLYTAQKDAEDYKNNHIEEFYIDGEYSYDLFLDYQLDKMLNSTKRKEYMIIFNLIKQDKDWVLLDLTEDDLEKIHGIYGG